MNRNFEIETSTGEGLEKMAREEMMKANHIKPQEISADAVAFQKEYQRLGEEYDAIMDEQTAALLAHDHEKAEELLSRAEEVLVKIQQLERAQKNGADLIEMDVQKELDNLRKSVNKSEMN